MNVNDGLNLSRFGITLNRQWAESYAQEIRTCNQRPTDYLLFKIFLNCNLEHAVASSSFPTNVHERNDGRLEGPFIFQVNEVKNIAEGFEKRSLESTKRVLKFFMSDGRRNIVGLEYQYIPDITMSAPSGYKIAVANVAVRRGLLLLTPDNVHLLGGRVQRLGDQQEDLEDGQVNPSASNVENVLRTGVEEAKGVGPSSAPQSIIRRVQPGNTVPNPPQAQQNSSARNPYNSGSNLNQAAGAARQNAQMAAFDEEDDDIYNLPPSPPAHAPANRMPNNTSWLPSSVATAERQNKLEQKDTGFHRDEAMVVESGMTAEEKTSSTLPLPQNSEGKDGCSKPGTSSGFVFSPDVTVRSKRKRGRTGHQMSDSGNNPPPDNGYSRAEPKHDQKSSPPLPMQFVDERDSFSPEAGGNKPPPNEREQEKPSQESSVSNMSSSLDSGTAHGSHNLMKSPAGDRLRRRKLLSSFKEFSENMGQSVQMKVFFDSKDEFKVKQNRYHLVMKLRDDCGNVDSLRISNAELEKKIFKMPAERFKQIMSSQDPSIKETGLKCAEDAQNKLSNLGFQDVLIQIPKPNPGKQHKKQQLPTVVCLLFQDEQH